MRKHLFSLITALLCLGNLMTVQADTWTPAGTPASVFTNEWTPNTPANDMTLSNGLYVFSKSVNFSSNTSIAFKVCKNHDWSVAYPSDNYNFTIPSGAKYLIITYNTSGNVVDACAISTMTVAGSNTTLFGTSWAPSNTANDMTLDGSVYKFEKEHVTLSAGTIEFKAVSNHNWGHEWPSDNYQLNIPESGEYTVTITFDPATLAVNATATLEQAVVVIPTVQLHSNIKNIEWESADFTIDEGDETASLQLADVAAGNYSFGIKIDGNWTSNGSAFTRTDNSKEIVSGSGDCSFTADIPGNYTFTWRYADNTLSIGYPDKVEYVEGLIAAIGEVTLESASAINAARTAYDGLLSEAQQAQVSNYGVLTDAEDAYETLINQIAANDVKDLIDAIPNPVVYTGDCYNAILAARNGYNNLTAAQQALVGAAYEQKLAAAEAAYNAFIKYTVAGEPESLFGTFWDPEDTNNDMELQSNGTYKWEKTDVALAEGTIKFKVCKDHSWAVAYPNENYVLPITEDGLYTVTVTFDPSNNSVAAVATKTGEAVIVHVAQMKGSWDEWAAEVDYVDNGDGTASIAKRFEATGEYMFKVIIDGSYRGEASTTFSRENNVIAGIVNDAADMKFEVDVPGCYTFTWNFEENKLAIDYQSLTIDVAAIVNNQTGTIVAPAEQVEGTPLNFGVAADGSRVEADAPNAIMTVAGTFKNEHGMQSPTFTVMVPGSVDIYVGKCTYSTKTINVRNAANYIVASKTPTAACWKDDRAEMTVLHYEGVATTLTISGMDFCPYIRVKNAPVLDPLPAYINVQAQVNNQAGTLLTSAETAAQGNAVSFGVNAANERVAADAANAIMTVAGNFHSDHGLTNSVFTVRVPGDVDIYVGECDYSATDIVVRDEDNNIVTSLTPAATACWKNDKKNVAVLHYVGGANTLTIRGMQYCPYVCVKSTPVTVPDEMDIQAVVNNQDGTLVEAAEQIQGTPLNFGVAADGSRVAVDNPNAILYVDGKYHNDHGMYNPTFTVRVPGEVEIYVGECTYSTATIEVRNAANELVDSKTPEAVCWKNNPDNLAVLHYTGEATTLTISGMTYCPFIRVKTPTPAPQPEEQNITPKVDPQHDGLYYSTFYDSQVSYELPAGVEAYVATISGNDLLLTKIAEGGQVIPADNAVILKSTVSPYTLTPSDAAAVSVSANSLQGTDVAMATPAHCYVLSGADGVVGFYPYGAEYLNPHKAYVIYSAQSNAPRHMRFIFDTATDITNVQGNVQNTKVLRNGQLIIIKNGVEYNVSGQKVK